MGQLVNRAIFRYIVLLIIAFAGSVTLMVVIHALFQRFSTQTDTTITNLQARLDISRYIISDITQLHLSFLELTAATDTKQDRAEKITTLRSKIHETEKNVAILNSGGIFSKTLVHAKEHTITIPYYRVLESLDEPMLDMRFGRIFELIDTISRLTGMRDEYLASNDKRFSSVVAELRHYNRNLGSAFSDARNMLEEMIAHDHARLKVLQNQRATQEERYIFWEILTIALASIAIIWVIYNILSQILSLYKELENQLYTDGLTKLGSRNALLKELSTSPQPAMVLIDIRHFRTLNELYGIEVGNEVLVRFAMSLRHFANERRFKLFRISGDEFVLFKTIPTPDINRCILLLDTLFAYVAKESFYIEAIADSVHIEINAGISYDKHNPLGTADIALNHAKAIHKPYVFYHENLASIQEIKEGVHWRKQILYGLENELFIPFFQPIVDRHGGIVKYEALMRFMEYGTPVRYISPVHFLDIVVKTGHYDQISKMVLLKSLQIAKAHDLSLSLNLNYHDITNDGLHSLLKKSIEEMEIGHRLVFEIVESEMIHEYGLVKQFMETFRALGVRFAIDDFGTGFSNFSHIFELAPDFIKIDGSLIKNIHTDKKSYELVKAIVFFSKELGIQTVAEFVHCEKVYEVAYALGIDQFQGYFFGEPKAIAL